jgi:hypothetical protein
MATLPETYFKLPLLPHSLRYVGYLLILISLGAAYLYFWGGRPAFFEVPVFAVVSSYLETRWLVMVQTNILDEIAVVTMFIGLLFVAFSSEVSETGGVYQARVESLIYAVYGTTGIFVVIYLTVFGWPATALFAASFGCFLVIYTVLFRLLLLKDRVEVQHQQNRNPLKKESYE